MIEGRSFDNASINSKTGEIIFYTYTNPKRTLKRVEARKRLHEVPGLTRLMKPAEKKHYQDEVKSKAAAHLAKLSKGRSSIRKFLYAPKGLTVPIESLFDGQTLLARRYNTKKNLRYGSIPNDPDAMKRALEEARPQPADVKAAKKTGAENKLTKNAKGIGKLFAKFIAAPIAGFVAGKGLASRKVLAAHVSTDDAKILTKDKDIGDILKKWDKLNPQDQKAAYMKFVIGKNTHLKDTEAHEIEDMAQAMIELGNPPPPARTFLEYVEDRIANSDNIRQRNKKMNIEGKLRFAAKMADAIVSGKPVMDQRIRDSKEFHQLQQQYSSVGKQQKLQKLFVPTAQTDQLRQVTKDVQTTKRALAQAIKHAGANWPEPQTPSNIPSSLNIHL